MSKLLEREYFGEFTFLRQWNQAGRPEGVDIKGFPQGRFTITIDNKVYDIPEELAYWLHTIDYYKQPKKQRLGFGKTPIECNHNNDLYSIKLEFPFYEDKIRLEVKLIYEQNNFDIEKFKNCTEHTINCGEEFDWGDGKVTKEILDLAIKKKSKEIRKIANRKYAVDINLSNGQGGDDHLYNFNNRLFRVLLEKKINKEWDIILINRSQKINLNTSQISTHPWVSNFENGGLVKELNLIKIDKNNKESVIYENYNI